MSKHTPGPWTVGGTRHYKHSGSIDGVEVAIHYGPPESRGNCIAFAYGHGPHGDAEADARLIAAAPELLSQLEFAVALLKPMFGHAAQVERMEDVIAKATGETK